MVCKLSASFKVICLNSGTVSEIGKAASPAGKVPGLNRGVTVPAMAAYFAFGGSKTNFPSAQGTGLLQWDKMCQLASTASANLSELNTGQS